ncbi:MAG TPA: carboxymuconolactone decarboxylase family protein [Bdellovibrionales bacterium]|nr:carboxymuconolactone decarboxylase family protein [Bdellovibrionales bacterium]
MRMRHVTDRGDLPEQHRPILDEIVQTRGHLPKPFALLLNHPELAERVAGLGSFVRYESSLPDRVREIAILTSATENKCAYARDRHEIHARNAGVPEDTINAILEDREPLHAGDRLIVSFGRETLRKHAVGDSLFENVKERLGPAGVLELTGTIGYYALLAVILNTFDSPRD